MAKKKKKNNTTKKSNNALLSSFLILTLSFWMTAACVVAGIKFAALDELQSANNTQQANILGQSISQQINHGLTSTQDRLNSIAEQPQLLASLEQYHRAKNVHNDARGDAEKRKNTLIQVNKQIEQLKNLAAILQSSFPHAAYLHILPWDQSGTAGIKTTGIKLQNNIEGLMVAKAGSNEQPIAEAYQTEQQWFLAFATPIVVGKKSIGVLLLSIDSQFLKTSLDTINVKQLAKITVKQKGNNKAILAMGQSQSTKQTSYPIPISQGEVIVQMNESVNQQGNSAILRIYIFITVMVVLLSVLSIIIYGKIKSALKSDIDELQRFANSLSGLHQTSTPALKIVGLANLIPTIEKAANSSTKSAVTHSGDDDAMARSLNNIAKAKSQTSPDDVIVELSESFGDELNLDEEPELDLDLDLDLNDDVTDLNTTDANAVGHASSVDESLFRDYDIRGHAEQQLTDDLTFKIGQIVATKALQQGLEKIVIAMDGRLSGKRLKTSLCEGILSTGCNAIDIGQTATPVLYYAIEKLETKAGIMITGSHNAAEMNGFKIVLNNKALFGDQIKQLAQGINAGEFKQGQGSVVDIDMTLDYSDEISHDIIAARPIKVVVDGANGTGGQLLVNILEQIDCEVIPLYCDTDGHFPNHSPDPSRKENLNDLINIVQQQQADIGIALDGDADRMVAVSSDGNIIAGDQLLAIFSADVVSRNPAASVVFDVKCSRSLGRVITQVGGRPIMWKSGHSNIKAKMLETSAILGGEFTGHFCFKERWYGFDDGIYAALRLIEILSVDEQTLDQRIQALPASFSTDELLLATGSDDKKFSIMMALKSQLKATDGSITDIDGIRIDFEQGWGLIRASNTSSNISARFEADTQDELDRIRQLFQQALQNIDASLQLS